MTGKHASPKRCPVCGGALQRDLASVPYVLENNVVVVVKHTPVERCVECNECYTTGRTTDQIVGMLQQLKQLNSEVSVIAFVEGGSRTQVDVPILEPA